MSKLEEADSLVKKAEKSLKTSFFKWSPDTEGAIANYTKAAECYKAGKDFQNSIMCYKTVADLYQQSDSLYYCAKALEDAANLYKELKDYKNTVELILSAGEKLRVNGNADSACQLMKKMAKAIEDDEPKEAARLYLFASDASQDKDDNRSAVDFSGLAGKLFARVNDFDNALKSLKSKTELSIQSGLDHEAVKAVACQIIIHLYNNDFIAASKVFERYIETNSSAIDDNSGAISQLLNAYERQNFDDCRRIFRLPIFMYLDNDFVRLAQNTKFPEYIPKSNDTDAGGEEQTAVMYDIN